MTKSTKPRRTVEVAVMSAKNKTAAGRSYPTDVFDTIIKNVENGMRYTIEEVSPAERNLKKIMPFQSWPEHAMADCVSARIADDGMLMMTFEIRSNRFGKLLEAVLDTHSMDKIDFFPVGIGNEDENHVVRDYKLAYVTFEVKGGAK